MEIDNTYQLTEDNYHPEVCTKNKIVIGNTLSMNMTHYDLWLNKMNGKFKGTSAYTIGLDGTIYEHFNPKHYSDNLRFKENDKESISILLENEGWLTKNYNTLETLKWDGDIYNRGEVVRTKWRGKLRWAEYNDLQLDSLVELCNKLLVDFNIERFASEHNVKILDIDEKSGIYYRSNFTINYLDISPAFNFNKFKNKIETK